MKKLIKNRIMIWAVSIVAVTGIVVAAIRYFSRKKETVSKLNSSSLVVGSSSGGSGTPATPVAGYSGFTIKTAYLDVDGITYLPYASIEDALDKNLEDSGFTNQNGTVYATAMNSGNIAYSDATGDNFYPQGFYFYDTTFEMLLIDENHIMHFYNDVDKTGLNSQQINDSTI